MILAPLLAALALSSRAADYVIQPSLESGKGFTVVADRPPVQTVSGDLAFPTGTTLEVRYDRPLFGLAVFVTAPTELTEEVVFHPTEHHPWRKTFSRPGGYMLEYARWSGAQTRTTIHFTIVDQPETLATLGPPVP